MVTCAMRCLFAVAMLATNVCAFVAPGRLSPAALRARQERLPAASAVPHRKSRRWIPGKTMKYGREDASATNDQSGGPLKSLRRSFEKAASTFARMAKPKDQVDDLLNSDAFLHKKVEMLQKQIRATRSDIHTVEADGQKQWDEWGPQVQRLEKEFDLLKSRGSEARTRATNKGKAESINDILSVADNFERAAEAISAETDGERAVVDYYKGVYDTMIACLEGLGLEEVEHIGAAFDYNIHNAIMRESTSDFEENVVCKVFQKGYRVGDTLVRPAMVAVAVPV